MLWQDKRSKEAGGLLREMAEEEQQQLREIRLRELSRHSQFSGSFVRVAEVCEKMLIITFFSFLSFFKSHVPSCLLSF